MLDLFCCAGGAAMGYARAGFRIVGVDHKPQPNYPFVLIEADALEYVAREGHLYDIIHASPPCQHDLRGLHAVNRKLGRNYDHLSLTDATREALRASGKPYVIEQPEQGAQLENPVRLCGSSFGLPIRRHRQFESNVSLSVPPCDHGWQTEKKYWTGWRPNGEHRLATVVQVYGNGANRHEWPAALGIDWMSYDELAQAIPPAYTEHIGHQLMAHLATARAA